MKPQNSRSPDTDRLIGSKEVLKLVPYSLFHLSRLEGQGKFPVRMKLGAGRIAWSLREVEAWIEQRKAARKSKAAV